MNERLFIRRLMFDRYRRSTIMPRYTPIKWWECDLFELTAAGYFREYEVKLTRADFKADRVKYKTQWSNTGGGLLGWRVANKHQQLASRQPPCPTQFWYVCPDLMVLPQEVPEWAGLIVLQERYPHSGSYREIELKAAPRLHNQKMADHEGVRCAIYQTAYHRFMPKWLSGPEEPDEDYQI